MSIPSQSTRIEAEYLQSRRDMAASTWHSFTYTRKTRRDALSAARDTWANIAAKEALAEFPDAAKRAADIWHLLDVRYQRGTA